MKNITLITSLMLLVTSVQAATLLVDLNKDDPTKAFDFGDVTGEKYATVQEALTASVKSDTILVAPGVYECPEALKVKPGSTLQAADPNPENTTLRGTGEDVYLALGEPEGLEPSLIGFTVTNFTSSTTHTIGRSYSRGIVSNCVIRNCSAKGLNVYLLNAKQIVDTEIRDCDTYNCHLLTVPNTSFVSNCLVSNNTVYVDDNTSGLYMGLTYTNARFDRMRFIGNRVIANRSNLSAISDANTGSCSFYNSIFIDNIATNYKNNTVHAGQYGTVSNCVFISTLLPIISPSISHCVVSNCYGPYFTSSGSTVIDNSLFIHNRQTFYSAIGRTPLAGLFYHCTFIENSVYADKFGVLDCYNSPTVKCFNSIVYGNTPRDIGKDIVLVTNSIYSTSNASAEKTASCFQVENPQFNLGKNPNLPNYVLLSSSSPAYNKGDPSANVDANGNPVSFDCLYDLAGNPRIFGGAIDIGCYEWFSIPGFKIIVR